MQWCKTMSVSTGFPLFRIFFLFVVHTTHSCPLGCFCHWSQHYNWLVSCWLSALHCSSSFFSFSAWKSFHTPLHQGFCVSLILHSHISFSSIFPLKQRCSATQMTSNLCSLIPAFLSCPLLLPRENVHISYSPFHLPGEGNYFSARVPNPHITNSYCP